jgi:hypothetical protein
VEGATGYELIFNEGDVISVVENFYAVSNLEPSTPYEWQVRTVKGKLKSEWNKSILSTAGQLPAPVLHAPVVTVIGPILEWDPVDGATDYEIETGLDTEYYFREVVQECVSYPTGLPRETRFEYRVRAIKGNDVGAWANGWFGTFGYIDPNDPINDELKFGEIVGEYGVDGFLSEWSATGYNGLGAESWSSEIVRLVDGNFEPINRFAILGMLGADPTDPFFRVFVDVVGDKLFMVNDEMVAMGAHDKYPGIANLGVTLSVIKLNGQGRPANGAGAHACELTWNENDKTLSFPEKIDGSDYMMCWMIADVDQYNLIGAGALKLLNNPGECYSAISMSQN